MSTAPFLEVSTTSGLRVTAELTSLLASAPASTLVRAILGGGLFIWGMKCRGSSRFQDINLLSRCHLGSLGGGDRLQNRVLGLSLLLLLLLLLRLRLGHLGDAVLDSTAAPLLRVDL